MAFFDRLLKYYFFLLFYFLSKPISFGISGKYPIQNFTPTDYQAGIQNIDFAQNRDMTLFIANNLGVLSFNGNDWGVHAPQTGKKQRSLIFDKKNNRLYVGSQGAFGYFQNNWEYVSLVEKIPLAARDFDEVWDVFLFNSKVYFCTFQGIYIYDGANTISVLKHQEGFNRSFFTGEQLFTQSQSGALLEIKDQNLIPFYTKIGKDAIIVSVLSQNQGHLIFYNSGKIEFRTSFGTTPQFDALSKALQGKYVNHVLQLSDTRLAISTQNAGLFLYDSQKKSIENITSQDGLLSNACLRAFQDYSGNLWIGMQNGIALIDINAPMRFINQEINLQGSGYDAYETEAGIYYTTSNGIYFLAKNDEKCIFLDGTEGPAYALQKIAGRLYAGHHTGLFLLENGKAKRLATLSGLWRIQQLRSNPQFAIGGTYSGLHLFNINIEKTLQSVQQIDGFAESSRFFEEDRYGKIWVGQFYKGLFKLTLDKTLTTANVTKIHASEDLPIKDQLILSRIDNQLYLGTLKGVYVIDPATDQIEKASGFSAIGEQPVYLLKQDDKKNSYVFAENTIGLLKQIGPNNHVFVPSALYQIRYSLNNDLLNLAVNIDEGVLFNANEGFTHYKPELDNPIKHEKLPVIKKVLSVTEDSILYQYAPFEGRAKNQNSLTLSSSAKVVQFEVESFQLTGLAKQNYRYFLNGFDKDYSDWTDNAIKEYTNLPAGNYEFTVQTRDYLGKVATSQPLLLTVKPPFYKSNLARLFYALLVLLILYLLFKFQKNQYQQKSQKLEAKKQQELALEQQKLATIEQQKEQELVKLKEEKTQNELQHLNNLLATSTMNLVVKNEFIDSLKEELNEVKRKGKNVETRKALEKVVKKIDSTLRLQEDWQQFEYHFDKVHGNFLTRLRDEFQDLSPNEQKLCAFLRLNLNTKEIANLMGISQRGVEVARYRLRKKLNLQTGDNLSKFVLEY